VECHSYVTLESTPWKGQMMMTVTMENDDVDANANDGNKIQLT